MPGGAVSRRCPGPQPRASSASVCCLSNVRAAAAPARPACTSPPCPRSPGRQRCRLPVCHGLAPLATSPPRAPCRQGAGTAAQGAGTAAHGPVPHPALGGHCAFRPLRQPHAGRSRARTVPEPCRSRAVPNTALAAGPAGLSGPLPAAPLMMLAPTGGAHPHPQASLLPSKWRLCCREPGPQRRGIFLPEAARQRPQGRAAGGWRPPRPAPLPPPPGPAVSP